MSWQTEALWSQNRSVKTPCWIWILHPVTTLQMFSSWSAWRGREGETHCHWSSLLFFPSPITNLIRSFTPHASLSSPSTHTEHFDSLSLSSCDPSVNLSLTTSLLHPSHLHSLFFSHYLWILLNAFCFTLLLSLSTSYLSLSLFIQSYIHSAFISGGII